MNALLMVGGFLLIAACVIVIACITMMDAKSGLGTIAGEGGGTFFDQNRGKTKEAMLKRAVWVMGTVLAVLTLIVLFLV